MSGRLAGGPFNPAGYSASGTSPCLQASATGVTARHSSSASSPPTDSPLSPDKMSRRTRLYAGSSVGARGRMEIGTERAGAGGAEQN
jgi:hypothetical protein